VERVFDLTDKARGERVGGSIRIKHHGAVIAAVRIAQADKPSGLNHGLYRSAGEQVRIICEARIQIPVDRFAKAVV